MKSSRNPNLGQQEDDSDNEEYINTTYPQPTYGAQGQPEPAQPTHGAHQQPTLGGYEGGTWNNPLMPAPSQPTYFQPPAPQPPQETPGTRPLATSAPQTPGIRGPNNSLRPPRNRAAVPQSDPHPRVAANHPFPQVEEQVGEGMSSGRNWLVARDGDQEPVLRAPLLIVRCKRDPVSQSNGRQYPGGNDIIPAGTSLTQVCQFWPRHVWGEMIRIFLSEKWNARRIWDLLPHNARNNASNRPWNYIQAAMGREVDLMMQEETGVRRVPERKAKTPTPPTEEGAEQLRREVDQVDDGGLISESVVVSDDDPSGDIITFDGVDLSAEHDLDLAQIIELTRQYRQLGVNAQRAILWVQYGGGSERDAVQFWRRRHNAWAQGLLHSYEAESGQSMDTREPVEMLRRIWMFLNPRPAGELLVSYLVSAEWHAWRNYAGAIQILMDQTEAEYNALIVSGAEDDGDAIEE